MGVVLCPIYYAVNYVVQQHDECAQLFHKLLCPPVPNNGAFSVLWWEGAWTPQQETQSSSTVSAGTPFSTWKISPATPFGFPPYPLSLGCCLGDDASTNTLNVDGFATVRSQGAVEAMRLLRRKGQALVQVLKIWVGAKRGLAGTCASVLLPGGQLELS